MSGCVEAAWARAGPLAAAYGDRRVAQAPGCRATLKRSRPASSSTTLPGSGTAVLLGSDAWRVRMAVANAGYLPSYVTKRAIERKVVRGVVFEMHPPAGVALQAGKLRIEGEQLEGHAPKSSLQAFLPSRQITADRAVAEWVVIAPRGTHIALTAVADRAGAVRTEVTLD